MAVIGNTFLGLADAYKRKDSNDKIADIIEMMNQTNSMLDDMVVVECNQGTLHKTTIRNGLPNVAWRKLYQGTLPSKSTTTQVTDSVGMAEARSQIDVKLLALQKDKAKFKLTESMAFIEAMNQEVQEKLIYGSTANSPEQFLGLAPRFNDLSAPNATQIVDAGGTGTDNTSIWFVIWGEQTVTGLYPEGSKAGLDVKNKGERTVQDGAGGYYDVDETVFQWDIGLTVRDWRYVVRIANIDVSDLKAGSVDLYDLMRQAYYRLHRPRVINGRPAIYCNRDVIEALDALATNAGASDNYVRLTTSDVAGKEVTTYRSMPIRQCDAILNTEARVV